MLSMIFYLDRHPTSPCQIYLNYTEFFFLNLMTCFLVICLLQTKEKKTNSKKKEVYLDCHTVVKLSASILCYFLLLIYTLDFALNE